MSDKKLYYEYFKYGEQAYREKMHYYERHQKEIWMLDFDTSLDINLDYVNCLFEVGRYERFLKYCDELIETVIIENIYNYRGENIYFELLFKKAACLYNIEDYEASMKLIHQLIKMDSKHGASKELYALCMQKFPAIWVVNLRAIAIASIGILLILTLVRILVIDTLYESSAVLFSQLQVLMFGIGVLSYIASIILFKVKLYAKTGIVLPNFLVTFANWLRKNFTKP
jgi:tetratricopeptide (TPR) repeat protein